MNEPERGRLWSSARPAAEALLRTWGAATAAARTPPEFLIVGGRRCGTTTLYYGLSQHPGVVPQVLSARWLPLREHRKGNRWLDSERPGGRWYRAHYPTVWTRRRVARHVGAAVTGEATPWYLCAPGAAERAAREAPDARIIVVLREPVARAFSQFQEQRRRGHEPLSNFEDALTAEDERVAHGFIGPAGQEFSPAFALEHVTYRFQSEYDTALTDWLTRFPREQVLVLQSEQLYADVSGALAEVASFLGLPPFSFRTEHRNRAEGPKATEPGVSPGTANHLAAHFAPHNEELERLTGQTFTW